MSDSTDLIINSLRYFDKNKDKYFKFISKVKFVVFIYDENDMNHNVIIFYDKKNNELFRSKFEIMGIYYSFSNTWAWAWSAPLFKKNLTYISKKILQYGLDIDDKKKQFLKTELITSRFRIVNYVQLDIHIAVSSYIAKSPMIFDWYFYPDGEKDIYSETIEGIEAKKYDITKTYPNKPFTRYTLFILDYDKLNL